MIRPATALVFAAALTAFASPGAAQVVENPVWTKPPDPDLSSRLLPGFAGWLGVSGQAELTCWLVEDGNPFNCRVKNEAPEGLGFGAAARLVVASAEIRTRRIDGVPVPGSITTTVRFYAPPIGEGASRWEGPDPGAAHLALARELVEQRDLPLPTPASIDGLDFDRRQVVGAWLAELFPITRERVNEIRALHMARLFSAEDIVRLKNDEPVVWPSPEESRAAFPQPTARDIEAQHEMRRRYCDRYGCDVEDTVPQPEGTGPPPTP